MNINERGTRPQHQVRAYNEEWTIIKRFVVLVKDAPAIADALLTAGEKIVKTNQNDN